MGGTAENAWAGGDNNTFLQGGTSSNPDGLHCHNGVHWERPPEHSIQAVAQNRDGSSFWFSHSSVQKWVIWILMPHSKTSYDIVQWSCIVIKHGENWTLWDTKHTAHLVHLILHLQLPHFENDQVTLSQTLLAAVDWQLFHTCSRKPLVAIGSIFGREMFNLESGNAYIMHACLRFLCIICSFL